MKALIFSIDGQDGFQQINKNWKDHVVIKQSYAPEYKISVSDPRLIKSIGWKPVVDFYQLANMMLHAQ
jgi:GDP-D-mannose dehydratase